MAHFDTEMAQLCNVCAEEICHDLCALKDGCNFSACPFRDRKRRGKSLRGELAHLQFALADFDPLGARAIPDEEDRIGWIPAKSEVKDVFRQSENERLSVVSRSRI